MGYYVINNLIKERINNMSKEIRNTIDTITHLDSMKAVKIAFELNESNQDSLNKVMQIVGGNVDNINLLSERIAKLEKRIKELETKEYERDLNERPKN